MNNYTTLYWITRLDAVSTGAAWMLGVGICIVIVYWLAPIIMEKDVVQTAEYNGYGYVQ